MQAILGKDRGGIGRIRLALRYAAPAHLGCGGSGCLTAVPR
jgi:hypothetical protein